MSNFDEHNIKKNLVFVLVFGCLLFGSYVFVKTQNENMVSKFYPGIIQVAESNKRNAIVYPRQYSDRNITENAKVTDPKYKDLSFVDKNSQVSSALSALVKRNDIPLDDNFLENGTWLWTPTLDITPVYADTIIKGASENSINTIYISIDSYLDIFVMPNGEEKEKAKQKFEAVLKDFISRANKNGIRVDAEAGWQNWAEPGNSYKANVVLDYVINFNKRNKEKFRGFQYDVEVYLLPEYFENREKVLSNFLNLINQSVTSLNNTDLQFSVVVPEFYDGTLDETPAFNYRGKRTYAFEHLLSILDRRAGSKIIIMSYRNFSEGRDGSIDISTNEVLTANKYNTKVIIAQETGDVPPPYITFYGKTKQDYEEQIRILENEFINEKSYGGLATHYINAFMELK
jgi:hypothetical protein